VAFSRRNVSMWAEEEGIDVRFLIHDRDTKFTEAFDEHFSRDDGGPVLTPHGAPIANCFVESWIGSLKRECLNLFFWFGLRQLDHIVQTYALYHNRFRPHQGMGNRPLGAGEDPSPQAPEVAPASIRCQRRLGGLLNHYYRQAARFPEVSGGKTCWATLGGGPRHGVFTGRAARSTNAHVFFHPRPAPASSNLAPST